MGATCTAGYGISEICSRTKYPSFRQTPAAMTVEEIIADFQAKGHIRPETADWVRGVYRYELGQHGDEAKARSVLVDLLTRSPEEHQQKVAEARAIVLDAVIKKLSQSPVPLALRILQVVVGVILGGVLAAATAFVLVYGLLILVEIVFGATPTHVRVPVKGVLAVLLAPVAGAVLGGLYGWKFDARVGKAKVQRLLDTSPAIDRAWIAWGTAWTGVVLVAFSLFDPFGRSRFRYWRDDDWLSLAAIWILPIIGGWAVAQLVRWVAAGQRE